MARFTTGDITCTGTASWSLSWADAGVRSTQWADRT
jgi:hypothetical protein